MAQFGRPNADMSTGSWVPSAGKASTVFSMIDEVTPDDATTYVSGSFVADTSDTFVVAMSSVTRPYAIGGHTMRARARIPGAIGGNSGSWQYVLRQGGTNIHTINWGSGDDNAWKTVEYTLSGSEVALITDYGDLSASISFTSDPDNVSTIEPEFTWLEFEVPSVSTGPNIYIYNGFTWLRAVNLYVYDGTTWQTGSDVSVYDGTTWQSDA